MFFVVFLPVIFIHFGAKRFLLIKNRHKGGLVK
jgi:hypothetical protein